MRSGLNTEFAIANTITAAAHTTDSTGVAVDLSDYNAAVACIYTGSVTDGTWTPELQETDTSSVATSWAAVTSTDLDGSFAAFTASRAAGTVTEVGYKGTKRYLRLVLTSTGTITTGGVISGFIVKGDPRNKPS